MTTTTCTGCGATIPETPTDAAAVDEYGLPLCAACRYHNQPTAKAWDDGAEERRPPAEPTSDFRYPAGDEPEDARAGTREILAKLLRLVCDANASALVIGQRALVIGYLSGVVEAESDADLADRLGISASRLSHVKRTIPKELTSLLRVKRRQAQPRTKGRSAWSATGKTI